MDIIAYFEPLAHSILFRLAVVLLVTDTVFGILRACRERKFNSCVGIDGAIRKAGMLISLALFYVVDTILDLNLIGFIPDEIRGMMGLTTVGVMGFFALVYCVYEIVSVLKNMALAGLPVSKIWKKLAEWLKANTGEISELPDDK